ncbi:MAG TPA: FAD-dependent oxidoreductase [Devosiaceae bacterium]|jgi:D-amino-acid dehydrogenase
MRIIVVGAGILGSSVAYHLSREGVDVTVIDEKHEGKATMAGAGIVCPWATKVEDPDFYRFYAAGGAYYRKLVAGLAESGETDFGYRQVGTLVLAESEDELASVEKRMTPRVAAAPEAGTIKRMTGKEAQALFPPLRDDLFAIHVPGGARVEARAIAAAMLRVAEANGAKVKNGHVELQKQGDRVTAVFDGEKLEADLVVVTAGAWANEILTKVGAIIPVQPQKGQIVHIRVPQATKDWPVLLPQGPHYMLAFDDNRVVAGATRETGKGFDYRVTPGGLQEVLNFALSLAPGLADATMIETRVGFRPATDGVKPMLGTISGLDGVLIGNGLGAGGLTMGPLAGRLLAQKALGQTTDLDLANYAIPA